LLLRRLLLLLPLLLRRLCAVLAADLYTSVRWGRGSRRGAQVGCGLVERCHKRVAGFRWLRLRQLRSDREASSLPAAACWEGWL
jgi:hypothetical protein